MRIFFGAVCFLFTVSLFAQTGGNNGAAAGTAQATAPASGDSVGVPATYRDFSLGMSLDDLKNALTQDALFNFHESDVSFGPAKDESYIETTGFSFVRRALFQIQAGNVFAMAFTLNTTLIDHYSVFTTLTKKYGEPKILDPKQAVWEDDNVRLSLERPLTIRYIDKKTFNQILEDSKAKKSEEVRMREDFLNDF
jgi:hypothetical protein